MGVPAASARRETVNGRCLRQTLPVLALFLSAASLVVILTQWVPELMLNPCLK
jgi:hypothetical protein